MSWLEFNHRVLHEALDPRTPLLERLKLLAIFSSNPDEFFMVVNDPATLKELFARVKVPNSLPRFVVLPPEQYSDRLF